MLSRGKAHLSFKAQPKRLQGSPGRLEHPPIPVPTTVLSSPAKMIFPATGTSGFLKVPAGRRALSRP